VSLPRRALWLAIGFVLAGALYLLLIDTVDLPELYAGAAAAALAAIAFEASREQGLSEAAIRLRWLAGLARIVLVKVPADILRVSLAALLELAALPLGSPRARRGVLRAVPFRHGPVDGSRDAGRRALAEAGGSLAPNTIVIGIDPDRDLLLVHQLTRSGPTESVDAMGIG
jgi:multisubunit Na+/H+ antiporter MnhE subunit